jgi:hypothetical protein
MPGLRRSAFPCCVALAALAPCAFADVSPTGAQDSTRASGTDDASTDFGPAFEATIPCIVEIASGDLRTQGFLLDAHGRLWLCAPPSAIAARPDAPPLTLSIAGAPRKATASVDGISTIGGREVGSPCQLQLFDVTAERDRLMAAGMRGPPISAFTAAAARRLPGSPVASISRVGGRKAIDVTRVRTLDGQGASGTLMLLSPPLPQSCASMPLVDRGGYLIGVGVSDEGDAGSISRAITAKAITDALHSEAPGWPDAGALESIVSECEDAGFVRLARWRELAAPGGSASFEFDPPTADRAGDSMLGIVPASATGGITLTVAFGNCARESDVAPAGDAARLIVRAEAAGANCTVTFAGASDANRALVIDAVRDSEDTRHLPLVHSLLPAAPRSWRSPTSGARDPGDGPIQSRVLDFPPSDPAGPIVRITMHGDVGVCGAPGDSALDPCFTAADFDAALVRASALRPSCVVLDMESGGGRVATMEPIMLRIQQMTAQGARVAAHCGDAGSAAALIGLTCPEVLVRPGARIGSAVTVVASESGSASRRHALRDDPELLKKYESFDRAKVVAASQSARRSPAILLAMIESPPGLWWTPSGGFSDRPSPNATVLDPGESQVLTLTADDITSTGLGKLAVGDKELRAALQLPADREIVNIQREMRTTYRAVALLNDAWLQSGGVPGTHEHEELAELMARP